VTVHVPLTFGRTLALNAPAAETVAAVICVRVVDPVAWNHTRTCTPAAGSVTPP